MKLSSFRLRIALLSAALAGSALVGFGAVSWFQIYNAKISRLDAEMFNQLMRGIRSPDQERWQPYAESLSHAFATNTKIPIALLVLDANGNTLYQFNSLPSDKNVNRLLIERLRLTLPPFLKGEPPPKPESRNPHQERFSFPSGRSANGDATRTRFIRPLPPPPPPQPQFVTVATPTETWRIGAGKFPNVQVAIAVSLQAVNQEMASIRKILLVSIKGTLLLVAGAAWVVSGGA